jgi:hypothetical protein
LTATDQLDTRGALLRTAVGLALVPPTEPELQLVHRWLDSWRGVGDVVRGMARQGWDLQLTECDAAHWRDVLVARLGAFHRRRLSVGADAVAGGGAGGLGGR